MLGYLIFFLIVAVVIFVAIKGEPRVKRRKHNKGGIKLSLGNASLSLF
jgi:large-conductance mechanosensitive channel